tara:strand:+ start:741 stop:1910 length:1170 start_codon:yes stop_codon:yes gene_type:complete
MARKNRQRKPVVVAPGVGDIGMPPSARTVGRPIVRAWQYNAEWLNGGWLAACSFGRPGEPEDPGYTSTHYDDVEYDFYIIHKSAERTNGRATAGTDDQQLCVVIAPWAIGSSDGLSSSTSRVRWTGAGESVVTVWEAEVDFHVRPGTTTGEQGERINADDTLVITDGIKYTADSTTTGGWGFSKLHIRNISPAAISVFYLPNLWWDKDDFAFNLNDYSRDKVITGQAMQTNKSLGDLIYHCGYDDANAPTLAKINLNEPLFQWIHPAGIWTDSSGGFVDIRNGGTWRVYPKNPTGGSGNVTCYPKIAMTTTALSGGTVQVKFTSTIAADSVTMSQTLNTTNEVFDTANPTLEVDPDGDNIKVEVSCPSPGEVTIHTVSLWEGTSVGDGY